MVRNEEGGVRGRLACLQIGNGSSGQKREPLSRSQSQGLMENLPHSTYE